MYMIPTLNQAKAHAKYISKVIGVKRTHAQEMVARIHRQESWAELATQCKNLGGTQLGDGSLFSCLYCPQETIQRFDSVMSRYQKELNHAVTANPTLNESLLTRVCNKEYGRISGPIIWNLLDEIEEIERNAGYAAEQVLECINYYDDSVLQIVNHRHMDEIKISLHPYFLGQRIYARCHVAGGNVEISLREWDLSSYTLGTKVQYASCSDRVKSICNRKWFKPYMMGYLKLIIRQLSNAGFSGKIRIHKIQNYSIISHHNGIRDRHYHEAITALIDSIILIGGKYVREDGSAEQLGIDCLELSFSATEQTGC